MDDEPVASREKTLWMPIVALALAMVVVTSDTTLAAVALPDVGRDLEVGPAATAWVVLGYALPMAAVAIPAGRWADRANIKYVFALSMSGVAVATVLATLAPSFAVLVFARLVQGFTAGLTMAVYMPIVASSVRFDQRGRAIGYIVTVMTIGGLIGAPLGGLLTEAYGWRGLFLMKLPVVVAALWLGIRAVPGNAAGLPPPSWTLIRDTLVMGGAVGAVLLCFDRLEAAPWLAAGCAVVGVALLATWLRLGTSQPLITTIRGRVLGMNLLGLFLQSFSIGLIVFLLPFFLSDTLHAGARSTGLALLAFSGAMVPTSPVAGWLADRFGPHRIAVIGAVITVVGIASTLTLTAQSSLWDVTWRLVLTGVGAGLFNGPINTALMAATPPDMIGTAGGMFATVRTMASTVAPAVTALVWTLAGGGLTGFHAGVMALVVIYLAGIAALLVGRPRPGAIAQAA